MAVFTSLPNPKDALSGILEGDTASLLFFVSGKEQ